MSFRIALSAYPLSRAACPHTTLILTFLVLNQHGLPWNSLIFVIFKLP
jgi:hypothetical protein